MARTRKPKQAPRRTVLDKALHDHAARVRHLVVLEASLLVARLGRRRAELLRIFSRLRDRSALMSTTHTTLLSITFDTLAALPAREQKAATTFIELVAELRWYLQYTEDMPGLLGQQLERFVVRLDEGLVTLIRALGPLDADGTRVVEAEALQAPG